jgi:cobyrinic acid a,c-diamide synthase
MSFHRILIAGTHSGVGKTTVATGIMAALRKRGLTVQGFKVGPDFIDPGFHESATGRPSHNLDGWMLSRENNLDIFARATADADVAVVEGVMGLFDGKNAPSLDGTTAEMAVWLATANILVLDAAAMAGSAAAIVHGFDTLISEFSLAAVVCNKVANTRHYGFLRDAISARCRPSAIGYLPKEESISIPDRHLGLHMAKEWMTEQRLAKLAESVESHLDLDLLLKLSMRPRLPGPIPPVAKPATTRIGVALDSAFCFYYHENLQMLRKLGAELVAFSPVSDNALPPDLDGIYLGGGYPELHAETLSANDCMRVAMCKFAAGDGPIYAECGGFMYLTQCLVDVSGRSWPMVGLFPTTCRIQPRLAKLGYIEVEAGDSHGWIPDGAKARGHEFRYSVIDPMPDCVSRTYREPAQGYRVRSVTGSYIHLHFGSCPEFAEQFVRACASYGAEKRK